MLEIGAGLGSLTLALAETGARVVAVETDRHLFPVLRSVVEGAGVETVEGDALELDLSALLAERSPGPWSLVANLPYNVATPLVHPDARGGARGGPPPRHGAAGGGGAHGGRCGRGRLRGGLGPHRLFRPGRGGGPGARPRSSSRGHGSSRSWSGWSAGPSRPSIPSLVSYDRLNAVVRAGFAQRRKMLRRSLAGVVDPAAFERAGVRPDARAEELDVAAWGRLAAL